jgi:hypothetical protein
MGIDKFFVARCDNLGKISIDSESSEKIWFETVLEYKGKGQIELPDQRGLIEGWTKIDIDELGEVNIEILVETINNIILSFGDIILIKKYKKFLNLRVTTLEGTFLAEEVVVSGERFNLTTGSSPQLYLRFRTLRSQFIANKDEESKYWVLPLSNFISAFKTCPQKLEDHPLLIKAESGTICLEYSSLSFFIQPLINYEHQRNKLLDGESKRKITSLLIDENGSAKFDIATMERLLDLLSLSTGIEVGAPWIEIRSSNGELIHRIHIQLNQWTNFSRGHAIFDDNIPNGIETLIRNLGNSPNKHSPDLTAIIKNIVKSGFHDLTTEDRFSHLFRVLDCLCDSYGLSKLDLRQSLNDNNKEIINSSFSLFEKTILQASRDMLKNSKEAEKDGMIDLYKDFKKQYEILQGIRNSLKMGPPYIDDRFGRKVASLLDIFDLDDISIVDKFYKENERPDHRKKLISILSFYRGVTMHRGYFNIHNDPYLQIDLPRVRSHLHDFLLRIILKSLCYDGAYKSTISYRPVLLDWVKPIFLFSWDKIPGKDNHMLMNFLQEELNMPFLNAKIEKNNIGNAISVYAPNITLTLGIDNSKTELSLNFNNKTISLVAKIENGMLNIYKPISASDLGYINS